MRCVENPNNVPIEPLPVSYLAPDLPLWFRQQFWGGRSICIYGYPCRRTGHEGWRIDGIIDATMPLAPSIEWDKDGYGRTIPIQVERLNMLGSRIGELGGISGAAILDRGLRQGVGVQGSYAPKSGEVRGTEIAQLIEEHPNLASYFQQIPPRTEPPDMTPLRKYLEHLLKKFQKMEIYNPLPVQIAPNIEDVFVYLTAAYNRKEEEEDSLQRRLMVEMGNSELTSSRQVELRVVGLLVEAVKGQLGIIITGDPGAGKTTFLKYLTVLHSKSLLTSTNVVDILGVEPRLPIFISLRDFADYLNTETRHRTRFAELLEFYNEYLAD